MASTNQGLRQASVRAVTGTALTYNGDWHALFDLAGIPAGPFNGRMLAWINDRLGTTYPDLPGAIQAFAESVGAYNWPSMGTFDAGGFEGILDQLSTTPVAAWSVARRLTADYEGALIRLRRSSDNAESDFNPDDNGDLDTAAITTWLGGGSGFLVRVYDQIGSNNMVQGTAGNQPDYSASGCGDLGKPGFAVASGDLLTVTNAALDDLWATDGMAVHAVHKITGTPTSGRFMLQKSNSGLFQNWYLALTDSIRPGLGRCDTGATSIRGGSADAVADTSYVETINSPLAYNSNPTWRRNGAALTVGQNGAVGAGIESESGTALAWPARSTGQQTGVYSEVVLFGSQLSSDDMQALNDDTTTYFNG